MLQETRGYYMNPIAGWMSPVFWAFPVPLLPSYIGLVQVTVALCCICPYNLALFAELAPGVQKTYYGSCNLHKQVPVHALS